MTPQEFLNLQEHFYKPPKETDPYKSAEDKLDEYNNLYMKKDMLIYIAKLAEEVGEVAEIAAAYNGSRSKENKLGGRHKLKEKMTEEIGDVIAIALTIARQYGINNEEVWSSLATKLKVRIDKIARESD